MTIDVRRRSDRDLDGCLRLVESVHRSDAYPTVLPDDPAIWLSPTGTLGAWVAVSESRIVGHIALRVGPSNASVWSEATQLAPDQLAVITRFLVSSDSRDRGAGSQLFDAACGTAAEQGLRPVLDVLEKNRDAIQFYERRGWRYISSSPWTDAKGEPHSLRYYVPPNLEG